jgi:hypothetical protein
VCNLRAETPARGARGILAARHGTGTPNEHARCYAPVVLWLVFGAICIAGGMSVVGLLVRGVRRGRIPSLVGGGGKPLLLAARPIAFVLTYLAWVLILALSAYFALFVAFWVPVIDFAIVPGIAGPIVSLILVRRRRGTPVPREILEDVGRSLERGDAERACTAVECVLPGTEQRIAKAAVDAVLSDPSPTQYRDTPARSGAIVPSLGQAVVREGRVLAVAGIPAGLVVVPWLVLAFVPDIARSTQSRSEDALLWPLACLFASGLAAAVLFHCLRTARVARAAQDLLTVHVRQVVSSTSGR